MRWYKDLYLGTDAGKKRDSLIQKIENGKTPVNTYLITLPAGQANQLEILPAWNLWFWQNGREPLPLIVGLARGRAEALEVVRRITEDVLKQRGDCRIRLYFEQRQEDSPEQEEASGEFQ